MQMQPYNKTTKKGTWTLKSSSCSSHISLYQMDANKCRHIEFLTVEKNFHDIKTHYNVPLLQWGGWAILAALFNFSETKSGYVFGIIVLLTHLHSGFIIFLVDGSRFLLSVHLFIHSFHFRQMALTVPSVVWEIFCSQCHKCVFQQ